jgi:predicted Holliday junction resolvase-like endonuclease
VRTNLTGKLRMKPAKILTKFHKWRICQVSKEQLDMAFAKNPSKPEIKKKCDPYNLDAVRRKETNIMGSR